MEVWRWSYDGVLFGVLHAGYEWLTVFGGPVTLLHDFFGTSLCLSTDHRRLGVRVKQAAL